MTVSAFGVIIRSQASGNVPIGTINRDTNIMAVQIDPLPEPVLTVLTFFFAATSCLQPFHDGVAARTNRKEWNAGDKWVQRRTQIWRQIRRGEVAAKKKRTNRKVEVDKAKQIPIS